MTTLKDLFNKVFNKDKADAKSKAETYNAATKKLNEQATKDLQSYVSGQQPRLKYEQSGKSSGSSPAPKPKTSVTQQKKSTSSSGSYSGPAVSTGNTFAQMYTQPQNFSQDMYSADYLKKYYNQQKSKALADVEPYYQELTDYGKFDFQGSVDNANRQLNEYLANSEVQLGQDKVGQDYDAAGRNTLFSSARANKRKQLQESYNRDIASKVADTSNAISNAANSFEYQYGSPALNGVNFNLPTATAQVGPTTSLIRGNTRAYSPRGYVGSYVKQKNAFAEQAAANAVDVIRNAKNNLY